MNRYGIVTLALIATAGPLFGAGEHCSSTYVANRYVPALGVYQKVARLTDPSGQQVAEFDLSWGAMLVSLKYNGTEYIAAPNTISGSQTIMRATNYTPTMGGDNVNRGSTVTGAACSSLRHLWISSGMTDYNNNAAASTSFVYQGNQYRFSQFAAPYVVSTHAYWVPNPNGTPQYYLRLDRTISNIDGPDTYAAENYTYTLDTVLAVPVAYQYYGLTPTCDPAFTCANSTSSVTAGYYSTTAKTAGIALATFPSTFWNGQSGGVYVSTEALADRRVIHLNRTSFQVAPQTSKTYSVYVMTGSWANASNFAARVCNFSFSTAAMLPNVTSTGGSGSISFTTNSTCSWDARSDASWVTVNAASGSGSGTVTYTLQSNSTGQVRLANIFVAGRIFSVWQG